MPGPKPELVSLSQIASRLNEQFERHLEEPIAETTPYDWWKRTKRGDISEPMPKPVAIVGRAILFRWGDIVRWFIAYKGVGRMKVSKKT